MTKTDLWMGPVRKPLGVRTKGLRGRLGRSPAEIAEGAEDSLEMGNAAASELFLQLPWLLLRIGFSQNPPQKRMNQGFDPTHPHAQVKTPPRPLREAFRIRMGRSPAEIAEGAEVYLGGGKGLTPEPFSATDLVCSNGLKNSPKR